MNDPLRDRLAGTDPLRQPADSHPHMAAPPPELLEHIMSTPVLSSSPTSGPQRDRRTPARALRPWKAAVAGGIAAAFLGVGAIAGLTGGGAEPSILALRLDGGDALASCLPFDVATLAGMPVAFEGTVTEVADGTVTLDVDRWYGGGDADTVTVSSSTDAVALVGGADFRPGTQYLVSASDGAVSVCGYSGEATDELRSAFEQAFPR